MKHKKGSIFMVAGIMFLCAAAFLTGYNQIEQLRAARTAQEALQQLVNVIPTRTSANQNPINLADNTATEMQTVLINDVEYIGVLKLLSLDLELPVRSELSEATLKQTPCYYEGSFLSDDLIIAGHNYTNHFGNLRLLAPGDSILFIDALGFEYCYEVAYTEVLDGTDVSGMLEAGEWDLTLFTCTYDGTSRTTVRCTRVFQ